MPLAQLQTYAPLLQARETLPNLQLTSLANILGGREANALSVANLFANQAEQRRAGTQALAGTGRTSPLALEAPLASIASTPSITGVSDLNASTRATNDWNQQLALDSFLAGERARAGLGSSIAKLFGQAARAGYGLPDARYVSFQSGGYVPAPPGSPVPATVHGGEYVVPAGPLAEEMRRLWGTTPLGVMSNAGDGYYLGARGWFGGELGEPTYTEARRRIDQRAALGLVPASVAALM